MNSGEYLTVFLVYGLGAWVIIFIAWELINLYRRSEGNKSSLTASQYLIKQAKAGNRAVQIYILFLPIFLVVVGVWLFLHWEGMCINFNLLCNIDF